MGLFKSFFDYVKKESEKIETRLREENEFRELDLKKRNEIETLKNEIEMIKIEILKLRGKGIWLKEVPQILLNKDDSVDDVHLKYTEYKTNLNAYLNDLNELLQAKNENLIEKQNAVFDQKNNLIKKEKKEEPKNINDTIYRHKILKDKQKIIDRKDRIALFLQNKKLVSLGDVFSYYNPHYINYVMYMEDYLQRIGYKSGTKTVVEMSKPISFRDFKRNCVDIRSFAPLDLSKFDKDINLSGLEILTGQYLINEIIVNEEQLTESINKKWNNETLALLIEKNKLNLTIK